MRGRILAALIVILALFCVAALSQSFFIEFPVCTRVCHRTARPPCIDIEVVGEGPIRAVCTCSCYNKSSGRTQRWMIGMRN